MSVHQEDFAEIAARYISEREELEARYSSGRDKLLRHLRKAHKHGALKHEEFKETEAWNAILDALGELDPSRQNAGPRMLAPERARKLQDACDAISAALAEPVVISAMNWSMEGLDVFDPKKTARTVTSLKLAFGLAGSKRKVGTTKRTFLDWTFFIKLANVFMKFAGMALYPDGVVQKGPFVDFVADFAGLLGVKPDDANTIKRYIRNLMKE